MASLNGTGPGGAGMRHRGSKRGRRIGIVLIGTLSTVLACVLLGLTLAQGTWWYSIGSDRALSQESRARVAAIRDEMAASGMAPEAVDLLDAALDPAADPTTVRMYLLSALEKLEATGDRSLTGAAGELRAIAQTIRPTTFEERITPNPSSPVE